VTGKKNPLRGSFLNRLSFFNAKPINRDARLLVEPSNRARRMEAKKAKQGARAATKAHETKCSPLKPRRQLVKKDGTVIPIE
jgi:hypothetical protein